MFTVPKNDQIKVPANSYTKHNTNVVQHRGVLKGLHICNHLTLLKQGGGGYYYSIFFQNIFYVLLLILITF